MYYQFFFHHAKNHAAQHRPHTVPIPPITGMSRMEMPVWKAKTSPG